MEAKKRGVSDGLSFRRGMLVQCALDLLGVNAELADRGESFGNCHILKTFQVNKEMRPAPPMTIEREPPACLRLALDRTVPYLPVFTLIVPTACLRALAYPTKRHLARGHVANMTERCRPERGPQRSRRFSMTESSAAPCLWTHRPAPDVARKSNRTRGAMAFGGNSERTADANLVCSGRDQMQRIELTLEPPARSFVSGAESIVERLYVNKLVFFQDVPDPGASRATLPNQLDVFLPSHRRLHRRHQQRLLLRSVTGNGMDSAAVRRLALAIEQALGIELRQREGGRVGKVSTPSDTGKTRDKVGAFAGYSGRTMEKIAAVYAASLPASAIGWPVVKSAARVAHVSVPQSSTWTAIGSIETR
jgi:hypothetical protein